MYVPAQSAEISVVDAILCRIGAGDIQSKGVSTSAFTLTHLPSTLLSPHCTDAELYSRSPADALRCAAVSFMQEMLETAQILHLASAQSLVIVDEMGRGTSTEDGLGLAWATAEFLARRGSFSLFATHFHEMRTLADEGIGAVNRHVTALIKDGGLEYLYEVKEGASEESFGVECMAIAKLPPQLVELAREKLRQFEEERTCGARGAEVEVRREVRELKAQLQRLRDSPQLSEAERRQEKERIQAKAVQLQRRLQHITG
jgi:DNA mismatch repair ATPase MutS